jgi:pimeloyl-ACP methyl ester carboxylesterase
LSGRPERLLFLPGASGDTCFWRPLEQRLVCPAERLHLGWPGFGDTLARPHWVTHLVLCATSGGLPMASLGAADWRENVRTSLSHLPDWFATETTDLSDRLPEVATPTLLLWGDSDPFSPIAVGERLARQLPQARLEVIPDGDHDLGLHHAKRLAPLVQAHLSSTPLPSAAPIAPP